MASCWIDEVVGAAQQQQQQRRIGTDRKDCSTRAPTDWMDNAVEGDRIDTLGEALFTKRRTIVKPVVERRMQ